MITKQTAATLFSFGFRLVDKEGKKYIIDSVGKYGFTVHTEAENWEYTIMYNQIGTDFWVLKRDFSMLTKSITVEGEIVKPLIELGKLISKEDWFIVKDIDGSVIGVKDSKGLYLQLAGNNIFALWSKASPVLFNQEQLFQKLYSLHFIDLPEGTYKLIEE